VLVEATGIVNDAGLKKTGFDGSVKLIFG